MTEVILVSVFVPQYFQYLVQAQHSTRTTQQQESADNVKRYSNSGAKINWLWVGLEVEKEAWHTCVITVH